MWNQNIQMSMQGLIIFFIDFIYLFLYLDNKDLFCMHH